MSKSYFLEALSASKGKHLVHELQFASTYAVAVQDRELFAELLTKIEKTSLKSPKNRLSNLIAKRRAKRTLARADELFE